MAKEETQNNPEQPTNEPANDPAVLEARLDEVIKQRDGLLGEVKEGRGDRQELQRQLADKDAELRELQSTPAAEDPLAGDPEDVMTKGEVRKLVEDREQRQSEELQKREGEAENRRMRESEDVAKAKYTTESHGEGLDFDTVFEQGFKARFKENPGIAEAVRRAPNPGEELYRQGCLHPTIAKRIDQAKQKAVLEKIDNNAGGPRPSGGGAAGAGVSGASDDHSSRVMELVDLPDSKLKEMLATASD